VSVFLSASSYVESLQAVEVAEKGGEDIKVRCAFIFSIMAPRFSRLETQSVTGIFPCDVWFEIVSQIAMQPSDLYVDNWTFDKALFNLYSTSSFFSRIVEPLLFRDLIFIGPQNHAGSTPMEFVYHIIERLRLNPDLKRKVRSCAFRGWSSRYYNGSRELEQKQTRFAEFVDAFLALQLPALRKLVFVGTTINVNLHRRLHVLQNFSSIDLTRCLIDVLPSSFARHESHLGSLTEVSYILYSLTRY